MLSFSLNCVLVVLALFGTVSGDEIRLKNGDRLSGKVVSMEKDLLTLSATYAGNVNV